MSWLGGEVCRIDADLCRSGETQSALQITPTQLTYQSLPQLAQAEKLFFTWVRHAIIRDGTESLAQMADTKTATGTDWQQQLLCSS